MSKSYKKNPGHYICNTKGKRKDEKIQYNSKWRRKNKISINDNFEQLTFPDYHDEIISKYMMVQDGDYIFNNEDAKYKRK